MIKKRILFLGKKKDYNGNIALEYLKKNFDDVASYFGDWGDPFPEDLVYWNGDIIISYLSRWKIPKSLIDKIDLCINFHPGSHEYPGIGCLNFALYNNDSSYGVCCHHISEEIDSGKIIAIDTFPILKSDNVESLINKTYAHQLVQFYRIIDCIINNDKLPISTLQWKRKPYKRKEFEKLKIITNKMDKNEITRRIRATSYNSFQPKIIFDGHIFIYQPCEELNYDATKSRF